MTFSRPASAFLLIFALLILVFLPLGEGYAQIFKVQGGTSTMINAEGGSVEVLAPNYTGSLGLGFFNHRLETGAVLRSKYRDYTLIAGDDSVRFDLPTDLFDSSHYFLARGIGVSRVTKEGSIYVLGGTTSVGFGTGFFQSARSENGVGIMFFERRLTPTLRMFSRNVISQRQTALQGLNWQPKKWLSASLTAGLGSNQRYAASTLAVETRKLTLKFGYIDAGSQFHRITVSSPLASEVNKENFEAAYQPNRTFSISAGHHNLIQPLTATGALSAASVNEVVTNFNVSRAYFGVGLFNSRVAGRSTLGTNFYLGRPIGSHMEMNCNYFESRPEHGSLTTILSGTVRETLSQRFSLLQLISRSNGQLSASWGGEFLTNRVKVGADYQNVYLPLRPDRPFQQALALNVAIQVVGPLQLSGATNVAPDGHLRYTLGITTFLYRRSGFASAHTQDENSFSFPKYILQGIVRDSSGSPLSGIALRIGAELVFTDDTGRFLVRFRRRGPFALQLATSDFLIPGVFAVAKAPTSLFADPENNANDVEIVLRRVIPDSPQISTKSNELPVKAQ